MHGALTVTGNAPLDAIAPTAGFLALIATGTIGGAALTVAHRLHRA